MNINSNNYKSFTYFILVLIAISVVISYGISLLLKQYQIVLPFYVDLPISTLGVYSILFWFFNNYLWKSPLFKKVGIIIADDLNGTWQGIVKSSYDNFKKDVKAELVIEQTATSIKICGTFDQSKSVSVHENFGKSEIDNEVALFYFFRNEPKYDAVETMAIHEGSTKLTHNKATDTLSGYYYSGRDRNNHGTIEVKRVKKT